jgi:phosphoenolpyruvate---glycerone phosphotransferase subunit DhaM
VLVSHSLRLAEGLAEMVSQVAGPDVQVAVAAGAADGRLGTNATAILEAIQRVATPDGVVVLLDLGSAALSVEMALEELTPEGRAMVAVSSGPLVEGAVVAAVTASVGASLAEVLSAADEAAGMPKLPGATG